MCPSEGCIYVQGHGGDHFAPEDGRDHSDEIRLRILHDRVANLEAELNARLPCGHPAQCAAEGDCIVCSMLKVHERMGDAYEAQLAEARKDSERLDWLDHYGLSDPYHIWANRMSTSARAAIDAAMEKKP